MKKAFIAIVQGIVQGVWFRCFTRETALRLQVTGTVKNLPTKEVEIVAEGSADALKKLAAWLHKGSPAAKVSHVELIWTSPTGKFDTFSIIE